MGSSQPCGRIWGTHRKVNVTMSPASPRLPMAGHGCMGHHGITPGFVPSCPPLSSTVRSHSQDGPHHVTSAVGTVPRLCSHGDALQSTGMEPAAMGHRRAPKGTKPRGAGRSLNTPHSAKPRLLISPLPQKSGGPTAKTPSWGLPQATGFIRATGEVASPHSSSSRFAGRATTKIHPTTPPLTSGGEAAAGHGFILLPRPLPGAVGTSQDDSKPWDAQAPSLLILNLLVCKAAVVVQRLLGHLAEVAPQGETETQRGTAP